MNTLLDITVLDAVQAMIVGIERQNERKDFEIVMSSYGGKIEIDSVCYGCAATCAIQELFKKDFTDKRIKDRWNRSEFMDCDEGDLYYFESAIDFFRMGDDRYICNLLQMPKLQYELMTRPTWELIDSYENFVDTLPKIMKWIKVNENVISTQWQTEPAIEY
ncbi:hypothetical protein KAR91_40475 [Candidatus Pacearchaeota archaeon]|nr:hypothetical protein [Candidatus Pacearchaeota archaeon]